MAVIATVKLSKSYGRQRGIEDVTLTVEKGEIFGFLGPNGAGKTTTIRLLLGMLLRTGGTAHVFGLNVDRDTLAIRARTGYLPSDASLYPHLRGWDLVDFVLATRGLRDRSRARSLAGRLGVDLGLRVKQCSRGMRQKIAIVATLAHDPELLVLDEPSTGLDPLVQHVLADLLREETARGKTVFLSSHNLAEVESLCNRVAIIREGVVVKVDEVSSLRGMHFKTVTARFGTAAGSGGGEPGSGGRPNFLTIPGVRLVENGSGPAAGVRDHAGGAAQSGWITLKVTGDLRPLLERLASSSLQDLRVEDPTLEEVFMQFYSGDSGAGVGGEQR